MIQPVASIEVDQVRRRLDDAANPVRALDEVIDQAEHDMLLGLLFMCLGALIALSAAALVAVLVVRFPWLLS